VYNLTRPGVGRSEIWVHHFDDGTQQLLTQDGFGPKWERSGRHVVYVKWQNNVSAALMLLQQDGTERQLSPWRTSPVLLPTKGSRDGRSMLVSATTNDSTPLWLWSLERFSDKPEKICWQA
jgi:hypothetical protein